jgi:hypothetical protein
MYRLAHGSYDSSTCNTLELCQNINTRGNRFKLTKNPFHFDARKYFFIFFIFVNHIVSTWIVSSNTPINFGQINSKNMTGGLTWLELGLSVYIHEHLCQKPVLKCY